MKLKKLVLLFGCIVGCVLLVACQTNTDTSQPADDQFITSLAKGLDNRWQLNEKYENIEDSAKTYTAYIDAELKQIEDYRNRAFDDSKLQELVISYINELNSGREVAETYGSPAFEDDWTTHQNGRRSLLVEINDRHEIPVKDRQVLDELLSEGRYVQQETEKSTKITEFLESIPFELNQEQSNQYTKTYSAEIENTTGYNIESANLTIKLMNEQDVTVNTTYVFITNWNDKEKRVVKFDAFQTEFTKYEIEVNNIISQ